MGSMFYNCSSLKEIPLLDTSSVSSMYRMFYNCKSLITIPLLYTSSVSNIYRLFEGCSSLTTIPFLNTSNVSDMSGMFDGCSSLPLVDKVLFLDKSNNAFKRQIYLQMSKEQLQQIYDNLIV
jgi:surface protein